VSTYLYLQGINEDVDLAAAEDVVEAGGTYVGQPVIPTQAAEALNIVSSSANDAAAGTGARTVRVEGLNSSGAWAEEVFTLNGTTPVVSSSTWLRVIRAFIVAAGSGGTNAGAITVKHNTTTANIFSVIKAGRGMSMNAVFTVPAGQVARLSSWDGQGYGLTAANEATLELLARPTGTNQGWRVLRQLVVPATVTNKMYDRLDGPGLRLSALTDLKVRATVPVDNAKVVVGLNLSW
jgi:hypothetical protein